MFEKLEAYLEEISHFLSGREERDEILSEIKSHILEKAEQEFGRVDEASLNSVISAYGPARRVAERYLDGHQIIAPAYRRYLFRYTAFLFFCHFILAVMAVLFKENFILFPLLFVPRLGIVEAIMYLPTAFLTDLGIVTLVLYLITQSKKEIRLPWPRFAVDLDEVRPKKRIVWSILGLIPMLALTDFALYLYVKFHTIFFVNLNFPEPKPLLTPEAGRRYSLIVIALLAAGTLSLLAKIFTSSRWVDVVSNVLSLVLIGIFLRQPFDHPFAVSVPEGFLPKIKFGLTFALFFFAVVVTIELIRNLILIGRKQLAK